MYKITLADGTVIDDISVNGTTLVAKRNIDESVFEHNLSPVDIEWVKDEEKAYPMMDISGHHENMQYIHIESPNDEFWFGLADIPHDELRYEKLRSDIEYISMMTDIEL